MSLWEWVVRYCDLMLRETSRDLARYGAAMEAAERRQALLRAVRTQARSMEARAAASGVTAVAVHAPDESESTLKMGAASFPITTLEWKHRDARGGTVVFNGQKSLVLGPTLARLVEVLGKQPIGPDGWPVRLTIAALTQIALDKKEPGKKDFHKISQQLTRLQQAFRGAGVNPHWIARDLRTGVRLLIRRDTVPPAVRQEDKKRGPAESSCLEASASPGSGVPSMGASAGPLS